MNSNITTCNILDGEEYKVASDLLQRYRSAATHTMKNLLGTQEQYELEVRFFTLDRRVTISREKFEQVASMLRARALTETQQELTLKVHVAVTGEPDARIVISQNGIQHYNQRNVLDDVSDADVVFQRKQRCGDVRVPQYHYRIVLATESEVDAQTRDRIRREWCRSRKYYRIVKRRGFMEQDGSVRYDLSCVMELDVPRFDTANLPRDATYHFEVEMEVLRSDITMDTLVAHTQSILHALGVIGTCRMVMDPDSIHQIRTDVKQLCRRHGRKITQPIALENVTDIEHGYTVTEKADGARTQIYIDATGHIYLLSSQAVIDTGIIMGGEEHRTCLCSVLDAEHITKFVDSDTGPFELLLVFDAYVVGDAGVWALPLVSQDEGTNTRMSHIRCVIDVMTKCFGGLGIVIRTKQFRIAGEGKTIYELSKEVLETKYIYNTDGLIYTPINGNRIYKWKLPRDNSIDFLVRYNNALSTDAFVMLELYVTGAQSREVAREGDKRRRLGDDAPVTFERFAPPMPEDVSAYKAKVARRDNGRIYTTQGNTQICDGDVVEMQYDLTRTQSLERWVPLRVRYDKRKGNYVTVANSVWKTIHYPITVDMITGRNDDRFYREYARRGPDAPLSAMRQFHNRYIKQHCLYRRALEYHNSARPPTVLDVAVGKGGDLPRWQEIHAGLVVGIDIHLDNISDSRDGAEVRYQRRYRDAFAAFFLHGDTSRNITSGDAFVSVNAGNLDAVSRTRDVLGVLRGASCVTSDRQTPYACLNDGTLKGVVCDGFDIVTCQFALHYYFDTKVRLEGFVKNVAELTRPGGVFLCTTYNGARVFDRLKSESRLEMKGTDGVVLMSVERKYRHRTFVGRFPKCNYPIEVYIQSIGAPVTEYLVDFEYFDTMMSSYGFNKVAHQSFGDTFAALQQLQKDSPAKFAELRLDNVLKMSEGVKQFSFMNDWAIYRRA